MFNFIHNFVKVAVDRIGGPTKAAHALGVSNTTIHDWVKRKRVSDIEKARIMAKLGGVELQQIRSTL